MRLLALLGLLLVLPVPGLAQGVEGPSAPDAVIDPSVVEPSVIDPRTYGVSAKTFLTLSAWHFVPISSTATYQFNNNPTAGQTISRTGAPQFLKAPLHLPEGALVTEVEFVVCDTSPTAAFSSFLFRQPRLGAVATTTLVTTTGAEAPGCVDRTATLATPIQIDNNANSYNLEVNLGAADTTIQLASARVGYLLQVSPAPGAATFLDVPLSHPFFPFIEALAAAGITGGCSVSPPLYCPDDPLTRGQMAVFLGRALGLHFAP